MLSLFPLQDEPLQATTSKWNYLQEHVACFKNTIQHLDSDFPWEEQTVLHVSDNSVKLNYKFTQTATKIC